MNEPPKKPFRRKPLRKEPKKIEESPSPVSNIVSEIVSNLSCLKEEPKSNVKPTEPIDDKDKKKQEKLDKQKQQNKARREKKKLMKQQEATEKTLKTPQFKEKKLPAPKYGAFSKTKYETELVDETQKISLRDSSGHTSLTEKLISQLTDETYECLICVAKVKKTQAIWSCGNCSAIFHIACIKKWYKGNQSSDNGILVCPQCRDESTGAPNKYVCFCGKNKDPDINHYITPHSCGNTCEKIRKNSDCPHKCNLLCHPGACPPCAANRLISCYCGQKEFSLRCSEASNGISCTQVCGKLLSCKKHTCEAVCHKGECSPCTKVYPQNCYCGKTSNLEKTCDPSPVQTVDGTTSHFSCNEVCGKALDCKNHTCQKPCHVGPCGTCPFGVDKITTCSCGKSKADKRTSCLDPIPTCEKTCGKMMACGIHKCLKKCHNGPCGHCLEMRQVDCRCGTSTTKLPCVLLYASHTDPLVIEIREKYKVKMPYTCDRICGVMKNCTKHKCKTKCCSERKLHSGMSNRVHYSGNHICHITCGRRLNCNKHVCDHPCHPGECEPCKVVIRDRISCKCGKSYFDPPQHCGTKPPHCPYPCSVRRTCGHSPKHTCHDHGACPPCMELVSKPCVGGHGLVDNIACCTTQVSCGSKCGKQLGCGLHKCEKLCHDGPCLTEQNPQEAGCGQGCNKPLSCKHVCIEKCHPTKECPTKCSQKVKTFCECRHLTGTKECDELRKMVKSSFPEVIYDVGALPPMIDCNSECRLLSRNKRLAEAFNIDVVKHDLPHYGKHLISFGIKNPKFVVEIEQIFAEFLGNPNATKYSFQHMGTDKRVFVHDLASHYDLMAESVDRGQYKSSVLIKTIKSQIPPIRLSVVLSDVSKLKILEEKLAAQEKQNNQEPQSRTYQKKMHEMKLRELDTSSEEEEDFPEDKPDEDDGWETVPSNKDEPVKPIQGQQEESRRQKKIEKVTVKNFWGKLDE